MSHHSCHERTSSTCDLTSAVRRSALRSHRCWRFRLSHPAHCRSAADQRPRPSAPHRNNAHPLRTVSSHETRSSLIATNPPATVMCLENRPERRQDPWDCGSSTENGHHDLRSLTQSGPPRQDRQDSVRQGPSSMRTDSLPETTVMEATVARLAPLLAPCHTCRESCNALTWRARQDSNPRPAA